MPEVSLVAVLDADKEGFLRSDRSLIQTIGRAARNINGAAILYADTVTGSMQRAIDETNRRRKKQIAFNKVHGITPRGIRKAVADIMEGAHAGAPGSPRRFAKVAESLGEYAAMTPSALAARLRKLEQQMYRHAGNLEFEEAARVRDQMRELRERGLAGGRKRRLTRRPAVIRRLRVSVRLGIVRCSRKARSSVVEHHVDIVGVGGSIPLAPTMSRTRIRKHVLPGSVARPHPAAYPSPESFTERRRIALLPRGRTSWRGGDSGFGRRGTGIRRDMRRNHGLK